MKYFAFITAVLASLLLVQPAFADQGYGAPCNSTYGQPCAVAKNLLINKEVQNPQSGDFVDNLGTNDPKFGPMQLVPFRVTVKNTGDATLSDVTVVDTLPNFVTFESGAGSFDSNSNKLTFHVVDLKAGESRSFTITAKTVAANDLPSNQGITCVTNNAFASSEGMQTSDNAQFCIQTQITTKGGLQVFPAPKVTKTPPTGPEALPLLGFISSAVAGLFLKKRSK
jgi:uncharacterized repeat protein (TIGR01451 family)